MVEPAGPDLAGSVERARAGDPDAFEAVYRAHAGRVYALCLRMSADAGRAAELTQDVFVRAWEKLGTFRGESAFSSWLHSLAVNVVLNALRAERRRSEEPMEDETATDTIHHAPSTMPVEDLVDLEAAIASLPPMARQVVVLHDLEGYEHAEIGRMLGIAEGTSKAHCFRARRLLRERLSR